MAHREIANEIYSQLGGQRFQAMTGAKNLLAIEFGLQFNLPRGFAKDGISTIRIQLDSNDTYTVRALKWNPRKLENKEIEAHSGVYADNLRGLFTSMTGLDTSL